ncbi:MAG: carboxypeptidase regulatory-like domain-containing protein [Anaerolineae bacterium]|nr:MAG: carboxypeptidase regulatory-like domain-containing protein [Anaerolineae bacterium]
MPFDKTPSLDDFRNGMPDSLPDVYARRRKRMVLGVLLLLLVGALAVVNFMQTSLAAQLTGRGTVAGRVVDIHGQPTQAEIYVIGTDLIARTAPDGSFTLPDVPAGPQSVVVVDENSGSEYPVTIQSGQTTDIGEVQLVTTQVPEG